MLNLSLDERTCRLKRFTEISDVPTSPRTKEDFEILADFIKLHAACIRTQFAMIKQWQIAFNKTSHELTEHDKLFDMNMRRWFQTFKPMDAIFSNFKSDAGLMFFDKSGVAAAEAKHSICNLKTAQKRKRMDENDAYMCPIPIRPKLTNTLQPCNSCNVSTNTNNHTNHTNTTCKTPPPANTIVVRGDGYPTPEERARRIIVNSKV